MADAVTHRTVEVPEDMLARWQDIVDIMADLLQVPAGLIMRLTGKDIEVFVSSRTERNPYHPGDREHFFDSGLYCETVVKTREKLLIPDALADQDWKSNPDVKLGMISYLGVPIHLPTGEPFGTICVLDDSPNSYTERYESLVERFRDLVEKELALMELNRALADRNDQLDEKIKEIRALEGLIPICAHCKKVRDDDGFWGSVEEYISQRSEADFSHGICPQCYSVYFGALEGPPTPSGG